MGVRRWFVLGFCWLATSLPAWATDPGPDAVEIPPVLISPRRIPGLSVNVSEFPGHATVITREEIERSGASSLPQVLNQQAGITLLDTNGFGLGADSTVNLRGVVNSSRTNVLVLLDGVRQNRVTGDEVHWQAIPLEQVERIEMIRGGGSLIYGEGALAGLINIVTKKGSEQPFESESGVAVGNFGRQKYFTSLRGGTGPLRYGTSFTRQLVTGYRESTNARTTTTTHHLGLRPVPELRLEANVLTSEDTTYFAGGITTAASEARRQQRGTFPTMQDDHTEQVGLEALWSGPEGLSLVASTFFRTRESDSDSAGSRFATIVPSKGLSLRSAHEWRGAAVAHTLVAGLDLLDEKATTGTRGASRLSESNKASYGLYTEETLRFWDRLSLIAGLRFDQARFDEAITFPAFDGTLRFQGWSPKVAVSLDVTEGITTYARFSRPFKSPNVDDFSVFVPSGFIGNVDLRPQQGDDYEVGMRLASPQVGEATVAWFYTKIDDEILFNDFSDQNENFNTERTGIEVSLVPVLPVERLTGSLTYTFNEAEFRKGAFDEYTIPLTPEHRVTAGLAYEVVPKCFLSLDWLLVSDFFRINDFNNVLPGDNYGGLNLGVRYEHKHVSAFVRLENVTNEEYTSFQSSNGVAITTGENPAPPFGVVVGVTVKF